MPSLTPPHRLIWLAAACAAGACAPAAQPAPAAPALTRCEQLDKKLDELSHALVPVLTQAYPQVLREVVSVEHGDAVALTFSWEARARLKDQGFGSRHAQHKQELMALASCPQAPTPQHTQCALIQQKLPALINNDYMRALGESAGVALAQTGEDEVGARAERAAQLLSVRAEARMASYLEPYMGELEALLGCDFL